MNESASNGPVLGLGVGGFIIGGVLGFLLRPPSALLIGQYLVMLYQEGQI